MSLKTTMPFRNITAEGWLNISMAGLLVFYAVQLLLDIAWNNVCAHLGIDYCAFWSAGRAANLSGYASAYNPVILSSLQSANLPAAAPVLPVSPVAYLPVFLLPFQILALLQPAVGFWIWTAVNSVCFVAYLRFFNDRLSGSPLPHRLLIMFSLCLPVYWNFLDGQVNVWLMICIGEFTRHAVSGQRFQSGLWLGGLLLKPQTLVLLALALLLQRSIRTLAGLTTSAAALLGGSLALVGTKGAAAVLQVWLGFARGIPANDVQLMMNWRMLALYFADWFSPMLGLAIAAIGITLTVVAALYLWRERLDPGSTRFTVALLGTLAATSMVAWHSNIHMAMILIPPMLILLRPSQVLKPAARNAWALVPAASYVLAYLLAALTKASLLPAATGAFLDLVRGASQFGVNALILVLALRYSLRLRPTVAGA